MPSTTSTRQPRRTAIVIAAEDPLAVVTTSTGYFKPGIKAKIVAGDERTVFLGPDSHLKEVKIPEFTLMFEDGRKNEHCQYGRDFVFAKFAA